jgi:hypothetical protein
MISGIILMTLMFRSATLANELADPGFENVSQDRLAAWSPYGRGYALDGAEKQSGRFSVRCDATGEQDGMGIVQTIHYDQPDKRPIIIGGWSKAEGVENGGDYCVYLDIRYDDGSPWWGKTAGWVHGSHGWQYAAEVYQPEKPIRDIQAFVFLRHTKGRAWFDDVFVHRGGLHATQVRVLVDFPRTKFGQRFRALLTQDAEWRAAMLDSGGQELKVCEGRGQSIECDWFDDKVAPVSCVHLTGRAAQDEKLDLTIPVASPSRSENPIRDGYVVWGETSMRKVYPTSSPPAIRQSELAVSLARNESEGVQVAIASADRLTLRNVQVNVGPLTSERGEVLPADGVTRHLVAYVYVESPSSHPAAPATSNWCPEVLLPIRSFEVIGGRTQAVWINFHAPESVSPGVYRGRITVTADNAPPTELPVSVRVRGFALSRSPRLRTAFAMMDGFTRATYGRITPELRRQCLDLMLSHRLNPDDISRTEPPDVADLLYAKDRGLTAFNILNLVPRPKNNPLWHCYSELSDYPADFNDQLAQRVDSYVAELRKQGLSRKAYFYGFDERGPEYDELIKGICKCLKQRYPEVSTFTTAGYMYQKRRTTPDGYEDYMDWYCPLTSVYDPELSARLRQQGKQVWWYVCCGPQYPYANFAALDYPAIEGRLLSWMSFGYQADGLLFWHVNFWQPNRVIDGSELYLDWKPLTVAGMTGDGCLTYPATSGPVSSIRLENVRDGLEDYDYLAALADARGHQAARKYVDRLVKSMTSFDRDPTSLSAVRDEIADQLEAMNQDSNHRETAR